MIESVLNLKKNKMGKLFVMAIPVLPDKKQEFNSFIRELQEKYARDFARSRQEFGLRERTFFQSTPSGDMVIVTLEGNDPEKAFEQLARKDDEFSRWFKNKVREIHGLDLSKPPAKLPELLIDSDQVGSRAERK